jgi:GNAT superfamily N-acetyltransferase
MACEDARPSLPEDAIRVRPANEYDDCRVAAMARALSQDSIRRRFLAVVAPDVAVRELSRETHCGIGEIAFVAEDADGVIVGEAYAALLDATSAEAAFVVADRNQHHGIGTLLFGAVVRGLAACGVRTMVIETHAQNAEMLALVHASGLRCTQRRIDETVELAVRLPIGKAVAGT